MLSLCHDSIDIDMEIFRKKLKRKQKKDELFLYSMHVSGLTIDRLISFYFFPGQSCTYNAERNGILIVVENIFLYFFFCFSFL